MAERHWKAAADRNDRRRVGKRRRELKTTAVFEPSHVGEQAQAQTIASHVAALQERSREDGGEVASERQFIDDGYSGSTLARPALERLRDAVAMGAIERLYIHSPDRLARRHAYQVRLIDEFQRAGVEVVFLNRPLGQNPEDELLLQVQGMIAEYERAKILERRRRGKRHRAQAGAVNVLSGAPYGYRYLSRWDGGGEARYEIIPEQAQVVRRIFAWVGQERLSIGEVTRRLSAAAISTHRGKPVWDRTTVWGLLRNPAYCGRAAFGKTCVGNGRTPLRPRRGQPAQPRHPKSGRDTPPQDWIPIAVPAIVSEELFAAVAEQLQENLRHARTQARGARYRPGGAGGDGLSAERGAGGAATGGGVVGTRGRVRPGPRGREGRAEPGCPDGGRGLAATDTPALGGGGAGGPVGDGAGGLRGPVGAVRLHGAAAGGGDGHGHRAPGRPWLIERRGLGERLEVDFEAQSAMALYRVSDHLLAHQAAIEGHLFDQVSDLFSLRDTVTLYDLTNTYFEGTAAGNDKAQRGHSKEKRTDCPLLTLGLVLDGSGFVRRSRVFAGNVVEGRTLEEMLAGLGDGRGALVVMDRGIATEDNLAWLRAGGYRYLVVSRERRQGVDLGEPPAIETADGAAVHLARGLDEENAEVRLYCYSEGRAQKETAIAPRFAERFEAGLEKIVEGLSRPRTQKTLAKLWERIGRLKAQSHGIGQHYRITLTPDAEGQKAVGLSWERLPREGSLLTDPGCYCLRRSETDWDSEKLWRTYSMLTDLEAVFRSLKLELGLRHVYHHTDSRADAHLFISVLAYQWVQIIRRRLREDGISDSWSSLRKTLSGQCRVTATFRRADGRALHVRTATRAEPDQLAIYQALGLNPAPGGVKKMIV